MFSIQCYGGFNAVNITSRVRGVIGDQNVVCAYIGRYKNCFKRSKSLYIYFSFTLSVSIILFRKYCHYNTLL